MTKTVREIAQALDSGNATLLKSSNGTTEYKLATVQHENVADRYIEGMLTDGLLRKNSYGELTLTERGRAYAQRKIN